MWSDSLLAGCESDAGKWKRGTYTPTFLLQSHLASQTLPTLRLSQFSFPGPPPSFIPPPDLFFSLCIYSVSKEMAEPFLPEKKKIPHSLGYLDAKSFNFGSQQMNTLFSVWCSHSNSSHLAI